MGRSDRERVTGIASSRTPRDKEKKSQIFASNSMLSFAGPPGGYYDEPLSPHGGSGNGFGGLDLPVRSFTTEYEDECVSVR